MSTPIYVQVQEQQEVLETVDEIKQQLLHAKQLLHEIYDLRVKENKQLQLTKEKISHIDERIEQVEAGFSHE